MDSTQPRFTGSRLLVLTVLFAGFSGIGTYVVYDQLAGKTVALDPRLLSLTTLLQAGGLLCIYYASDGLRLYYTLRALGQGVPLPQIYRLVFINIFFSNITPLATGGGFAQIWYLQRHEVAIGTATAATTIRTVLAVLFIFSLAPVFLLTLDKLEHLSLLSRFSGILALMIVLYLVFFVVALLRSRWLVIPLSFLLRLARNMHFLGKHRHDRWQFKIRREMLRFSNSFSIYLHGSRRDIFLSIFFTMIFLLSLFSFPALLIAALGYDTGYFITVGLLVVTTFIMYFSPTPGASGISEGVFGSFFNDILGPGHLVLVTLAWRFLTIYLGMLAGLLVTYLELVRKR